MQVLCGLQVVFFLFNCQTPAYLQILVSKNPGKDINAYYRSSAVAYALYGIVNAWILRGYQETPEQIAAILYDIQEKMPD